ncbi:elongation factor Ts [Patescibacteria group bacterium]|nr:elongation factor Ts [Patescibacteria group bacterium]HOM78071.1 elongation factor Ts [bacterium]
MDINAIKKLREETSASVLDVKKALEEAEGDMVRAKELLAIRGQEIAAKKTAERTVNAGLIETYVHSTGKVGSMVMLLCETDFVAKNEEFKTLAHEIAMQVAASDYESMDALLDDEYIKDGSKKIRDLITEAIAKIGEKIELGKFVRFSV